MHVKKNRLEDVVEPWKSGVIKEVYRIWPKVVHEFKLTSPQMNVVVNRQNELNTLGIDTNVDSSDFKLTTSMAQADSIVGDDSVVDSEASSFSLRQSDSTFNLSAYFKREANGEKEKDPNASDGSLSSMSFMSLSKILKRNNDISPIDEANLSSPPSMSLLSMIEQNRQIPEFKKKTVVHKVTVLSSLSVLY